MRFVLGVLFFVVAFSSFVFGADRPNILWITSEDHGPHLGCYGDSYAVTPNLDALAARGLLFTNASSNSPVCAPARTTIISGLYPPSTGASHMRSSARFPSQFRMFPQFLREQGYYCVNNSKEDYNLEKPGAVWDRSNRKAHWKGRAEGQPFFAVLNYTITHESQIRNKIKPRDQIHDVSKAPVPEYHPDTPEVRKDWAQYYDRITMFDTQVGKILQELEDAGLAEETIIFHFSDHGSGMPRSKRWLYNSGLNVSMMAYFPEKWRALAPKGYQAGGKSDRLVGFVDLAPTMLSLAGIEPPKWMHGGAFAGEFRQDEPRYSYGFRDRMDERIDLQRGVRDKRYLYIRNYMPHRIYGQYLDYMFQTPTTRVWKELYDRGKLTEAQSRFWERKPVEELYDLRADPWEVHNLAKSGEHQDVLARMRKAQQQWAVEIRDTGFLPEWDMHSLAGDSTIFEMAQDPERYHLESVLAAANVASSLDREKLPELVEMLSSDDQAVRYWGAVGLLAQEEAGFRAGESDLRKALDDTAPMVQITAAEALGRYGNEEDLAKSLEFLVQMASPREGDRLGSHLNVAAWNALDYLDSRALPVLGTIKGISTNPKSRAKRTGKYTERLKKATLSGLGAGSGGAK